MWKVTLYGGDTCILGKIEKRIIDMWCCRRIMHDDWSEGVVIGVHM